MENKTKINTKKEFFQTSNVISGLLLVIVIVFGFYVVEDNDTIIKPIDVEVEIAHLLTKELNPDLFLDEGLNVDLIHRIYPNMTFIFAIGSSVNEKFPNIPRGYCVESGEVINYKTEETALLMLDENGYMTISHGEFFDSKLEAKHPWSAIQTRSLISRNSRAIFLDKTKDDQFVLVESADGQMFVWSYGQASMIGVMDNLNSSDISLALRIGNDELSGGYFFKTDGEIVALGDENLISAIAVLVFE